MARKLETHVAELSIEVSLESELRQALERIEKSPSDQKPSWVAVELPVKRSLAWLLQQAGRPVGKEFRFFVRHSNLQLTMLAVDALEWIELSGISRFSNAVERYHEMRSQLGGVTPVRWLAGFSFAQGEQMPPWQGWPDGVMVLPRFLFSYHERQATATLTVTAQVGDSIDEVVAMTMSAYRDMFTDAQQEKAHKSAVQGVQIQDSDFSHWQKIVAETAAEIRDKQYEKVVLARQISIHSSEMHDVEQALTKLNQAYPAGYTFAWWNRGECFLGATPERLVKTRGGEIFIDCLAGTIARSEDAVEDHRLGSELMNSTKNRSEHAVVRNAIMDAVKSIVSHIESPDVPILRKLANVQHLYTPVTGFLREGMTVLDAAACLHPTPAVAGEPKNVALSVIRTREGMNRGWYAGAVGWIDSAGDGEFMVALRSLLIQGYDAHLFAGGGIMGDSDPHAEWAETKLKFRPAFAALGVETED